MSLLTGNSILTLIKPLEGKSGWTAYKSNVQIVMEAEGIWEYIQDAAKTVPTESKQKMAAAALALKATCHGDAHSLIANKTSASDIFSTLKKQYEANTPATRMSLRQRLYQLRHDPSHSVLEFINEIRAVISQLNAIGISLAADEVRDVVLMNLDSKFLVIQSILAAQDKNGEDDWTIDSLQDRLTSFESSMPGSDSPAVTALSAQHSRNNPRHHRARSDNWLNAKRLADVCERCGHEGHTSVYCFRDMPYHVKDRIRMMRLGKESANVASTPKSGSLNIPGLLSFINTGHIVNFGPEDGNIFKGPNLVAKAHYTNSDIRIEEHRINASYAYADDFMSGSKDIWLGS